MGVCATLVLCKFPARGDLELLELGMIVAPPGISGEDNARLTRMFEDLASDAWKSVLKSRGCDDIFLTGPALDGFAKAEQTRTAAVLKEVGLVK